MSWIKTIPFEASEGKLRAAYRRVAGPNGHIDNIMSIHSLRPHTLDGHMRLYKNVLHHSGNSFPTWWLETIGVYVSLLNRCEYCVQHHFAGLRRLLDDGKKASEIWDALHRFSESITDADMEVAPDANMETTDPSPFTRSEALMLRYARILTRTPFLLDENHIKTLRATGLSDAEILEINQVAAYFSYANRTVLGLGCSLDGDTLGLSPGDSSDPHNWTHE